MVKCSWSDSQSSSGDVVHVFMTSFRRQTLKSPRARFSLCVVNETRDVESRLIRTVLNRSRGCQTLINLQRAASSRTHLVLQAYCLTDVDEIKGIVHFEIKIWHLSVYPKGIQDVGVFFSSVDPILMFLGQTALVCQSYNGRYRSLSL